MNTLWCGTRAMPASSHERQWCKVTRHLRQRVQKALKETCFLYPTFDLFNHCILVMSALPAMLTLYQMFHHPCYTHMLFTTQIHRLLWKNSLLWCQNCNWCNFSWSQGGGEINALLLYTKYRFLSCGLRCLYNSSVHGDKLFVLICTPSRKLRHILTCDEAQLHCKAEE